MSLEDNDQEHIFALIREARQYLRKAYVPDEIGRPMDPAVRLLSPVLARLCTAVERLMKPTGSLSGYDPLDEYDPSQLEQIRLDLGFPGRKSQSLPSETEGSERFVISFPDIELDVMEIWPEGDAPEHPTPTDVINVMRQEEHACPRNIIHNWLLVESLFVRADYDEEGVREVEWDGT